MLKSAEKVWRIYSYMTVSFRQMTSALLVTASVGRWQMLGTYGGLSYRLAFGRKARHHEINDPVWRALCKANNALMSTNK